MHEKDKSRNMPKISNQPIQKIKIETKISPPQTKNLIKILEKRFEKNSNRHKGIKWEKIKNILESERKKIISLYAMETTGGEPDVISFDGKTEEYFFCDCSEQSPKGRRNVCYDQDAQNEREEKGVFPAGNAVSLAKDMGIELLTKDQYQMLQQVVKFDTTTSSWLKTPEEIRKFGGAIFADRRYNHVFIYHNSAPTFYSSRGFRGVLRV